MSAFFWLFGAMNVANGLWMLVAPASWYHGLPAEVPDTGPLNPHFVRDIGAAFLTLGVALWAAAPAARRHPGVLRATALFYSLHALVHVADLLAGRLAADHWLVDLPGVFVPAIGLAVLSLPRWWEV